MRLILLLALWCAGPALARPAMWVVRDADTEITIFGTIHAMPAGAKWLSKGVAARLDRADTLVLEAIVPEDPRVIAPMMQARGLLPAPRPLKDRVPKAMHAQLDAAVAKSGMPPALLERMKSWLVAITLTQQVVLDAGLDPKSGVEWQLRERAAKKGTKLGELEGVAAQFALFDGLPAADQDALLAEAVSDAGAMQAQIDGIWKAWAAGNVDKIAAEFSDADASLTMRKLLLTDRNANWAGWVQTRLAKPGRVMVAVGAGHLGGPDSLIAMLKARGLKVRRVE